MKMFKKYLYCLMILGTLASCQEEFLSKKQNKSLLVPQTLEDFEALLDGVNPMNGNYPSITYIASDDFYVDDQGYPSLSEIERAAYTWDLEALASITTPLNDWNYQYTKILHTNVVLDGLKNLSHENNLNDVNRLKGEALFRRAYAYYSLAEVFCEPFITGANNSEKDGLFIRLTADINEDPPMSNLDDLFDQILMDLYEAESLLPLNSIYKSKPNKRAVWALLSRIYLSILDFNNAKRYADQCLEINNDLLDYNVLDTVVQNPFPLALLNENKEVIFYSTIMTYLFQVSPFVGVDTSLYRSYNMNDLRSALFFTPRNSGIQSFTGHYSGDTRFFNGLSNDEVLLNRAECAAREGDVRRALEDLNYLLKARNVIQFEHGQIIDSDLVLDEILLERRKQLVGRGLRWSDLRRLYQDPTQRKNLVRIINGGKYELSMENQPFKFPVPVSELKN